MIIISREKKRNNQVTQRGIKSAGPTHPKNKIWSHFPSLFHWELGTDHVCESHSQRILRVHVEKPRVAWWLIWRALLCQGIFERQEASEGDGVAARRLFERQRQRGAVVQRQEARVSVCHQQLSEGAVGLYIAPLRRRRRTSELSAEDMEALDEEHVVADCTCPLKWPAASMHRNNDDCFPFKATWPVWMDFNSSTPAAREFSPSVRPPASAENIKILSVHLYSL